LTHESTGYRFQRYIGQGGSGIANSDTRHSGHESTILGFFITQLYHGLIIVGLPYAFAGQARTYEITGGAPHDACTIAGGDIKVSLNWKGAFSKRACRHTAG